MNTAKESDLTGTWQGLFNYPATGAPREFSATLIDAEGALTGSTAEIGERGAATGQTITATLQGRRDGHAVRWLKIYDAPDGDYDAVRYEGAVSQDGLEIEGRWSINANWSGTFLMIRAGNQQAEERERQVERAGV